MWGTSNIAGRRTRQLGRMGAPRHRGEGCPSRVSRVGTIAFPKTDRRALKREFAMLTDESVSNTTGLRSHPAGMTAGSSSMTTSSSSYDRPHRVFEAVDSTLNTLTAAGRSMTATWRMVSTARIVMLLHCSSTSTKTGVHSNVQPLCENADRGLRSSEDLPPPSRADNLPFAASADRCLVTRISA